MIDARTLLLMAVAVAVAVLALGPAPAGAAGAPKGPPAPKQIKGAAQAIQGDTVSINGTKLRLDGVSAPAKGQVCTNAGGQPYDCFQASIAFLQQRVKDREVSCTILPQSSKASQVGRCVVDGADLGAVMVMSGWALAYRPLSARYQDVEARAQAREVGLWAGRIDLPWKVSPPQKAKAGGK